MQTRATPQTTDSDTALQTLKLLADDTRWRLLQALRISDHQVGELVARLNVSQNLVSYHLGILRHAGLVQVRRSDADARATYYGLNLPAIQDSYQQIGRGLQLETTIVPGSTPTLPVIFLCTANSARSQMAEGWLRHLSYGSIPVSSAGTQPGQLHPLALQVMAEVGIDMSAQVSKGLSALLDTAPGVVVTVCDLAREQCFPCLNAPVQLHWSIPDPVQAQGSQDEQLQVFRSVRDQIGQRVESLLALLPALIADVALSSA